MTLYSIVVVALATFIGRVIWEALKIWLDRRRYPYRWTCDRCNFTIKSNLRESYEISKSSHNHISTEEYK